MMALNESYTEILKLDKMLTDANIPHTLNRFLDGWQICYPNNNSRVADAVQHFGSYGNAENLLEIMGLIAPNETSDSVLGDLTADDVFNRMSEHYKNHPIEKDDNKWIYDEENECFVCPKCGDSALNNYRGLSVDSNYCPHCGSHNK